MSPTYIIWKDEPLVVLQVNIVAVYMIEAPLKTELVTLIIPNCP